jgi:hypothetical protein
VNAIIDEPSRDGDERVAIVRDAEKLSGTADNEVFKATHHVSEIILSVRRVSDETKAKCVKLTMAPSKHCNCHSRLYEDRE